MTHSRNIEIAVKTEMGRAILQNRLGNASRLFRTVRHLRAGQVLNRISRRFSPSAAAPGRPAPASCSPQLQWKNCSGRRAGMLSPTRFRFVGHEAELNSAADWNSPSLPKLWLYNLHYFDDLRAEHAAERTQWHRDLIGRWLA